MKSYSLSLPQEIFTSQSSLPEICEEPVHVTSTSVLTIPVLRNPTLASTTALTEQEPEDVVVFVEGGEEPTKTSVVEQPESVTSPTTTEVEIVYVEADQPTSSTVAGKVLSSEVDLNNMA